MSTNDARLPSRSADRARSPRPRARRRGGCVVVAIVAVWIAGYGLGWFGRGAARSTSGSLAADNSADRRGEAARREVSRDPARASSRAHGLAPTAETDQEGRSTDMPEDRFESLLSLVRAHVTSDDLAAARGVLARVSDQVAARGAQRDRVARWSGKLASAAVAAEQRVVELLTNGRVREAHRALESLSGDGRWRPSAALAACGELGGDWSWVPEVAGLGAPRPFSARRAARVWWEGQLRRGVVISCNDHRVMVEVATSTGRRFPQVAFTAVEPVKSTAAEAVELACGAFSAGAPRLGRLWMARALLDGGEVGERGLAILKALRGS